MTTRGIRDLNGFGTVSYCIITLLGAWILTAFPLVSCVSLECASLERYSRNAKGGKTKLQCVKGRRPEC